MIIDQRERFVNISKQICRAINSFREIETKWYYELLFPRYFDARISMGFPRYI